MLCMARLLFTVQDHFDIQGRGVVTVPGLGPAERLWIGDPLEIRRPDGTSMRTRIAGLEMLSRRPKDQAVPVLFPPELTKDDLPLGAEVWSVDP